MRLKALVSATFLLCLLIYSGRLFAKWFEDKQGIMGTNIHVELWSNSAQQGEEAIQAVMDEMQRINQSMSPYIESSDLSKLNKYAAEGFVPVSKELFELIALSVELAKETDGAFDITFASVGYLYNYRESQKPPQDQIAGLLKAINYRHIRFDLTEHSIFFAHPNGGQAAQRRRRSPNKVKI